jgi:rhodanese-related sulfurtransferase
VFKKFPSSHAIAMLPEEANDLAAKGEITLVDVREDNEWAQMHVPCALHVPLSRLTQCVGDLPADKRIVFYCLSGQRSGRAIELCRQLGLEHNSHVQGGISAWRTAGLPITN